ncbi:FmdB family zinc ribbon protein [Acidihalobacter prosperus]
MPLYDYSCADCGDFSDFAPISKATSPMPCPDCGMNAPRIIVAPALALMPQGLRQAHARSEKSAHEPGYASRRGCGCHGAHTCGTGTNKPAFKASINAPTRPWMLGH